MPFEKSGLDSVVQSRNGLVVARGFKAVDDDANVQRINRIDAGVVFEKIVNAHKFALDVKPRVTLLIFHGELRFERHAFARDERREHGEHFAFGNACCKRRNIVGRVPLHFLSAHGRERAAYSREEQPQIFVNFGRRADGGTRVARRNFLADGDGGRQTFDVIAFGLAHSPEKLPRIGGKRLDVTALALGIKGVEGERRFAGPAHAGDDDERVARNAEVDIFQIIDPRALYFNAFAHEKRAAERLTAKCARMKKFAAFTNSST